MHRSTLGDLELTIVSDGTYFLDGGAFFGVVPKTMWSKKVVPDALNRLDAGLNSLLVRTGEKNILIETGIGNKLPDKLVQIYKQPAKLLDNLHAAGVAPEDIDIVINTHLHFDHCGWNTVRRGDQVVATFPNAKYYVQEQEWEHGRLQLERDAISYMSPNYDPLIETGQMVLLNGDLELAPGISVKVFPGHTANMQAVIIESGGGGNERKKACYISDLIATSAHLDVTWVMAFDLFPLQTIESRKKYYAWAIPERWLTVFTHDDQTPWGYVERGERGRLALKTPV
ncbi:MAG TPA: MBL fold metallo-hydrolase [Terriglobales bacterium]|jgi:glyoxylase-like metal-dependent hydrolase (beta-lactamase superfamily II)|nr:MBL fold metallo-hydrolase [Terriglobales bacterium]